MQDSGGGGTPVDNVYTCTTTEWGKKGLFLERREWQESQLGVKKNRFHFLLKFSPPFG